MINSSEVVVDSLGNEPIEVLGFETEEELEKALKNLMEEATI